MTNGELIRILRYKEDIKDYCQIDSVDVKGRNVSITGHLSIYQNDIAYTQLTLYYSNEYAPIEFNIYNAKRVTISTFDYNQNFCIDLKSLEYETRYCYCVGVKVRGDETYSPIYEFTTGDKSGCYTNTLKMRQEKSLAELKITLLVKTIFLFQETLVII